MQAVHTAEGDIRMLRDDELPLFRDHLFRLSMPARRDRFNGGTDDEFVAAYAESCFSGKTVVMAFIVDGLVRGAAELHRDGRKEGEIAFSVEDAFQHRGVGSGLFQRLIALARRLGYRELRVTTHPGNEAMKALARKFGADLRFQHGETVGRIELGEAMLDLPARAGLDEGEGDDPTSADAEATIVSEGLMPNWVRAARAVVDFHLTTLGLRR